MVAVYQRCLANYQSSQWDLGTYVLFNATLQAKTVQVPVPKPACVPVAGFDCVGDCLLLLSQKDPSPCLSAFLSTADVAALDYFEYEPLPASVVSAHAADGLPSTLVDACQAFTGPAQTARGQAFQACLNQYNESGVCTLPLHVWSGRSSNRMPVASPHATQLAGEVERVQAATRIYAEVRAAVRQALDAVNASWSADGLDIQMFSAEGDLLHQYFDCAMMGPLARVDPWPAPDSLNKPFWSRRTDGEPGNRAFELPCSGAQLNDRQGVPDTQSPLTCGSYARRSVIKTFVRDGLQSGSAVAANRRTITHAVQALLNSLYTTWVANDGGAYTEYQCQCLNNGTHSYQCCQFDCAFDNPCLCPDGVTRAYACCGCTTTSLLPQAMQADFTTIPGNATLAGLIDEAQTFLSTTVFTSTEPWLRCVSRGRGGRGGRERAVAQGSHALLGADGILNQVTIFSRVGIDEALRSIHPLAMLRRLLPMPFEVRPPHFSTDLHVVRMIEAHAQLVGHLAYRYRLLTR